MALNESQQDATCCSGNGLRLVVSDGVEAAADGIALNQFQSKSAARAKFGARSGASEMMLETARESWTVDDIREAVRNCDKLAGPICVAILALLGTVDTLDR